MSKSQEMQPEYSAGEPEPAPEFELSCAMCVLNKDLPDEDDWVCSTCYRELVNELRASQPPAPALDYHKLCDALQQAMLHECVPDMQTDDGIDYRFLDLMSDQDATIDTGKRRIEIFAERLADAVLEHLDSPTLTKGVADA